MTRTLTAVAVVGALLGAGCAAKAISSGSSEGRTVVLHYADLGRTVDLRVGDALVVDLRTGVSASLTWALGAYPKAALRVTGTDPDTRIFRFAAVGPGSGALIVQDSISCPGGDASPGGPPRACPFAGGQKPTSIPAQPDLVIRPFSVTVRVA